MSSSKKPSRGLWILYEPDYKTGRLKFKGNHCPRCKSIMAFHEHPVPRWYCGKCYYTEYVKTGGS